MIALTEDFAAIKAELDRLEREKLPTKPLPEPVVPDPFGYNYYSDYDPVI